MSETDGIFSEIFPVLSPLLETSSLRFLYYSMISVIFLIALWPFGILVQNVIILEQQ